MRSLQKYRTRPLEALVTTGIIDRPSCLSERNMFTSDSRASSQIDHDLMSGQLAFPFSVLADWCVRIGKYVFKSIMSGDIYNTFLR